MSQLRCRMCERAVAHGRSAVTFSAATLEQLYQHLEDAHHMAVARAGETEVQAAARFHAGHPEAYPRGGCDCEACSVCRAMERAVNATNN